MDPIMKFLEEDEDETLHSGAAVDAFTAELNRDIEGNNSTSQQPSDSKSETLGLKGGNYRSKRGDISAVISQGSCQTTSPFLPHWQTSSQDEIANFQSSQTLMPTEEKEQHSSQIELQQGGSESEKRREDDSSSLPHSMSVDTRPQLPDNQKTFPESQSMGGIQTSGEQVIHMQEPNSGSNLERESQMHTLQNISNPLLIAMVSNDQQSLPTGEGNQKTSSMGLGNEPAMTMVNRHTTGVGMSGQQPMASTNQQTGTTLKLNKQVPFGMLLPIIQPLLDKDRAMQLNTLYHKLKNNEISKEEFVRLMRSIVGDQMLKMAVYKLQTQAARNPQSSSTQFQSQPQASTRQTQLLSAQLPTDDGQTANAPDLEGQPDSKGVQVSQMTSFSSVGLSQDRRHPSFPTQGLNKQQPTHFPQTSFSQFGNAGSGYTPFSTNIATSSSLRSLPHDPQIRPTSHPNMTMSMMGMSKFDRSHPLADPKKMQGASLTHANSNIVIPQNQVQRPSSSSKDLKIDVSSSMNHVKQEPVDPSVETFETQSARMGLMPPTSLMPTSSIQSQLESNILSNPRVPSLTAVGTGNSSKATAKKPLVGQKKQMETPGSSPPTSKKQKVSGGVLDQSIEQLNDVTAVSGVNLREEEEQLFSGSKEDSQVSEASRRVVQEEEEKMILRKIPLQKKLVETLAKCGLKNMSNDVERNVALFVEERLRGLVSDAIRLSKQRTDMENPRHKTVITSDIRQQIMGINRKAREEWEKKQGETAKLQNPNEPDSTSGVDGDKEKDENRAKATKVNKEEDDKMRTTAANVAVRAAIGGGDMLSRWQSMIEAKQKQGGSDKSSASQAGKESSKQPSATSTKNTRENQESEKRDHSGAASFRKVGRNQVVVPRVVRSISLKDMIAVLEREPQMSKSSLLYRLYNKVSADAGGE